MIAGNIGNVIDAAAETGQHAEGVLAATFNLAQNADVLGGGVSNLLRKVAGMRQ